MARNKILHDTPLSPLTRWLERHLLHSGRPEMEESYNAPPSGPLRMFNDPCFIQRNIYTSVARPEWKC